MCIPTYIPIYIFSTVRTYGDCIHSHHLSYLLYLYSYIVLICLHYMYYDDICVNHSTVQSPNRTELLPLRTRRAENYTRPLSTTTIPTGLHVRHMRTLLSGRELGTRGKTTDDKRHRFCAARQKNEGMGICARYVPPPPNIRAFCRLFGTRNSAG